MQANGVVTYICPSPQDPATGTALAGSGCVVPPGVTVTPAPPPAHQQTKVRRYYIQSLYSSATKCPLLNMNLP